MPIILELGKTALSDLEKLLEVGAIEGEVIDNQMSRLHP